MNSERKIMWAQVCFLLVAIWALLPFGTRIAVYLSEKGTLELILVLLFLGVIEIVLHFADAHTLISRVGSGLISSLLVAVLAYFWFVFFHPTPAVGVHLLEYGVLAILIFRAVSLDRAPRPAVIITLALVVALGWFDEVIQYFLPDRYYDLSDVVINGVGGVLGLFCILGYRRDVKNNNRDNDA